jgi:hypothetical protein
MLRKNGGTFLCFVSLLLPAFVACGETDGPQPIARTELAKALAEAVCNNIGPCCRANDIPQDPELCNLKARTTLQVVIDDLMSSGRVRYDPTQAGKCVEAYKAAVIACQSDEFAEESCDGVFIGTQPEGGECTTSEECAPGPNGRAYCDREDDSPGHCVSDATGAGGHAKLGAPCTTSCSVSGNSVSCVSGGGSGSASGTCYDSDGLYCDFRTNQCAKPPRIGEACSSSCESGAYCDSGVCRAKISEGSCRSNFDACADGSYCNNLGQCEPLLKIGAACDEEFDTCVDGSSCENGVCRSRTMASKALCSGELDD